MKRLAILANRERDARVFSENTKEIESVLHAQNLIDVCADMTKSLNSGIVITALDCRRLYCFKTGKPIGNRDMNALEHALRVHGADYVKRAIRLSALSNCDTLWQQTDSETLDKLCDADRRGFAVYCLRLLTMHLYRPPYVAKRDTYYSQIEQAWSCARAYQILGKLTEKELSDLNDILCRVVTYKSDIALQFIAKEAKRQLTSPEEFAILAKSKLLHDIVDKAIATALGIIERHNQARYSGGNVEAQVYLQKFQEMPRSPTDFASGPSNIRGTKRSKREVMDQKLHRMYGKLFFDDEKPIPGQEAWRGKFARIAATQEQSPDANEFADMEFDLDELPKPSKSDNEIRISTMSRHLLAQRDLAHHNPTIIVGKPVKPATPEEFDDKVFAARKAIPFADRMAKIRKAMQDNAMQLRGNSGSLDKSKSISSEKTPISPQSLLSRLRAKKGQ